MNNLIERYIYDVIRRLPENIREDVRKELSANIQDMLPENPHESDIIEVLSSLGDPAVLAEQYRSRPRYLVSPALFDDYIQILKLVSIIAGVVIICVTFIQFAIRLSSGDLPIDVFTSFLVDLIVGLISAAVNVFAWVTFSFAMADYFCIKQNDKKEWTPSSLPPLPSPSSLKIKRSEAIADMIFSVLFTVIFIRFPQVFGWYDVGDKVRLTPIFNEAVISRFIPAFIIVLTLTLMLAAIKLIYGRWNFQVAVMNCVIKIISAVFMIFFISAPGLVTKSFSEKFIQTFNFDHETVTAGILHSVQIVAALTILFTIIDIVTAFYKAYKNSRLQN